MRSEVGDPLAAPREKTRMARLTGVRRFFLMYNCMHDRRCNESFF